MLQKMGDFGELKTWRSNFRSFLGENKTKANSKLYTVKISLVSIIFNVSNINNKQYIYF